MRTENRYLFAALLCFGLAAVLAVVIALSGCSLKSQQIVHVGVNGGDVVSTSYAEARGAVEANPVMRVNLPTRIALKSAQSAGMIWITRELAKRGHEQFAKGLLYAINAAMVGVVVNNWRVAQ